MKMRLYFAAACATLLLPLMYPSVSDAMTLNQVMVGPGSSVFYTTGSGTSELLGGVAGTTQLSYTTDYDEFTVAGPPPSSSGTVTVDVLFNHSYPGETWQLLQGTAPGTGTVVGSGGATNTPVGVSLVAGDTYFLEFNSTGAPSPSGANSWAVEVTPLPGALLLFAGGLGLLGITGMRKTKGRLPTSATA